MHEIIAKIARLAVGKAAAFSYAVAVGVAGNFAVNYLKQSDPAPAIAAALAPVQTTATPDKPAALPVSLPPLRPAALPSEATARPEQPASPPTTAAEPTTASGPPEIAALPPIGPAIEVAPPPKPPDSAGPVVAKTLAGPVPLLPSAAAAVFDHDDAPAARPKPASPGPGSGGLY